MAAKKHGGSRTSLDSWRKPLFDDLLRGVRLRSGRYFRPEFRGPWGISVARNCAVFHIVDRGNCWLQVAGVPEPVRLSRGDFVVVTGGNTHSMPDSLSTPTVNFFDLVKIHDSNEPFRIGGKGAVTRLICGGMQFETGACDPLVAILPPLLHVKRTEPAPGGVRQWGCWSNGSRQSIGRSPLHSGCTRIFR